MVNSGIISVSQRNPPESTLKERSVGKHIAPARGPHQGQGRETGGAKDAAGRQEKSRRCPMFRGARPRAKVLYAATGARSETRRQRKNRKVFRRLGQSTKSLDSVWRPMETAPRKRFRWARRGQGGPEPKGMEEAQANGEVHLVGWEASA